MKGLFSWIGFKQISYQYERDPRYAGESKFNYWKLWNFSVEGITSFTTAPLRVAAYLGVAIATLAVIYGSFILIDTIFYGNPVPGYPSLIIIVLLMGGVQLVTLGVIGEYLGRVFNESKQRPLYFIDEHLKPEKEIDRTTEA
jgi:hypothetical protein